MKVTIYCEMGPKNQVYPSFNELPLQKDGPAGNAWGLWGPDDQIGCLNHLTDDVVARAAREEIRTGSWISLKYVSCGTTLTWGWGVYVDQNISSWALNASSYPTLTRKNLELKLINKAPLKIAHDDEVC